MTDRAGVVVVGAGRLGGWASVFASADGVGKVVVLDRGLVGMGASSRAARGVRAQGGAPAAAARRPRAAGSSGRRAGRLRRWRAVAGRSHSTTARPLPTAPTPAFASSGI